MENPEFPILFEDRILAEKRDALSKADAPAADSAEPDKR